MNKDKVIKDFIKMVRIQLKKSGYRLIFENTKKVNMGSQGYAKGYHCPESKIIKIATKYPTNHWLGVLVHEFCHFLQYKEKYKPIIQYDLMAEENNIYSIKEKKGKDFNKCMNLIVQVELNCEKRAINLIKKMNLPIDKKEYIQIANASLHTYYFNKIKKNNAKYSSGKKKYYSKFSTKFSSIEKYLNPSLKIKKILFS